MDPIAAADQLFATAQHGSSEEKADLALGLFRVASRDATTKDQLIALAGFSAVIARQQVILDRLAAVEAKLEED